MWYSLVKSRRLQTRYQGPCEVIEKSKTNNYLLSTPDRIRKTKMIHVNMLKKYKDVTVVMVTLADVEEVPEQSKVNVHEDFSLDNAEAHLNNSDALRDIDAKITYLE